MQSVPLRRRLELSSHRDVFIAQACAHSSMNKMTIPHFVITHILNILWPNHGYSHSLNYVHESNTYSQNCVRIGCMCARILVCKQSCAHRVYERAHVNLRALFCASGVSQIVAQANRIAGGSREPRGPVSLRVSVAPDIPYVCLQYVLMRL